MAQEPPRSNIPPFRPDGYLPEGVYMCSEAEVIFRFGSSGRRRRRLVLRLRRWIELGRQVGARRLLVDGSFVTAKEEPDDLDAVILLPEDFTAQLEREHEPALKLEEMLLTRRPKEILAEEDETDWEERVDFFGRTRELEAAVKDSWSTTMITTAEQYQRAQEELHQLEEQLHRLQQRNPPGAKGFTKVGIRKMIARLHEELALYEGSLEVLQAHSS